MDDNFAKKEKRIIIYESDGISKVIDTLNEYAKSKEYVFRGYSKQDELLPSIIRDTSTFVGKEDRLLKDFERYGSHYFHASTPIDFMSYAQHFGLPTRLLDFTHNPFIALSFAIHSLKGVKYKDPADKDFYYIRCASIEENIMFTAIPLKNHVFNNKLSRPDSLAGKACQCIDSVTDLFGKKNMDKDTMDFLSSLSETPISSDLASINQKIRDHRILFIDPIQSNQRIIMQQGLFMFPYDLNIENHLKILNENSSVIMIHKELRTELKKYLDILGFNAFRLMPDLENICKAITQKYKDEKTDKKAQT